MTTLQPTLLCSIERTVLYRDVSTPEPLIKRNNMTDRQTDRQTEKN